MQGGKVLIVGAGGIGCELLKTLVLSGYSDLVVVDLDTIDKTNLNRQFLFKREDVGMAKATTAASVISALRPQISIQGLQANITSLSDSFFSQFCIVFNALDNLEARRYVNRICNYLVIPLIDAGTKAKSGQVTVHIPNITSCYDCQPKSTVKEYPVCTIRSTPNKPEHCIAWGKYLYETLFGPEDTNNMLSDINLNICEGYEDIFNYLFRDNLPETAIMLNYPTGANCKSIRETGLATLEELVGGLMYANELLKIQEKTKFCKDHKVAVQFVAAVSNLRAMNFGIPLTETFKVQEIAGNIIPAIGSTNAIVAGLQVIEGEKLKNNGTYFSTVWLLPEASNNKYIHPEVPNTIPNPDCFTCSTGKFNVNADFMTYTLGNLISEVLLDGLSFTGPSLIKNGLILYEIGEDLEEELVDIYSRNYGKTLRELGIVDGDQLFCDDFTQHCKFFLHLHHVEDVREDGNILKRSRDEEDAEIRLLKKVDD